MAAINEQDEVEMMVYVMHNFLRQVKHNNYKETVKYEDKVDDMLFNAGS